MIYKNGMSRKVLLVINWESIEESEKSFLLGAKLWAVKFASRLCSTESTMKVMGMWKSNILPCCLKEVKTNLIVLIYDHLDMTEVFINEIERTMNIMGAWKSNL